MQLKKNIFIMVFALLLCGCSSTDIENKTRQEENGKMETTDIRSVYNNLDAEKQNILKQNHDNMDFNDNFTIMMPDISKVETFTISGDSQGGSLGKVAERIRAFHQTFFQEEPEEDMDKLLHFSSEQVPYDVDEKEAKFPLNEPVVSDYRDSILNGDVQVIFYEYLCEHGFLEISNRGTVHWFNLGETQRFCKSENTRVGYIPTYEYEITEEINLAEKTAANKKIQLKDGEITLGNAVASCEKFFNESELTGKDSPFQAKVVSVNVLDMGNGVSELNMTVTPCRKGIPFEAPNLGGGIGYSCSPSSDGKSYGQLPASVFMLESGQPDIVVVADDFTSTVEDGKEYTDIIGPEDAFGMIADEVTAAARMKISSMELIYTPYKEKEEDADRLVVPAWKMTAYNSTDGRTYGFYVNAVNGEFHYISYD